MGKNKTSLGRSLIKSSRTVNKKGSKSNSSQHSTDLPDGYDWARLNLKSVTEQSTLEDFLSTAELAGTEFIAERQNIKIVDANAISGLLTNDEKRSVEEAQELNKGLLSIPRRPPWDASTTPEELTVLEKESFLKWRRTLAELQEKEHIILTPFEKNLEFWRQLWRVIERSDVVVQIVDARNPLLFRCDDLEKYVKEVSSDKENLLLLNKSDFLSYEQRKLWANYFAKLGLRAVFFSALQQSEVVQSETKSEVDSDERSCTDDDEDDDKSVETSECHTNTEQSELGDQLPRQVMPEAVEDSSELASKESSKHEIVDRNEAAETVEETKDGVVNSPDLLSREELLEFFKVVHQGSKVKEGTSVIGLVGYPNVGKSSTINALLQCKKVSVSATPGKTKHFQTIIIDSELCLCDCPGLVFPNFVYTKADMIINGILPIDEMTSHIPPVALVTEKIPRHILESTYGIMLPQPHESEDASRNPTAEELLNAYGYARGFMTHRGLPDTARCARYILKDFVNGKLLFCHAPPDGDQASYHQYPEKKIKVSNSTHLKKQILKTDKVTSKDVDSEFFRQAHSQAHSKGIHGVSGYTRKSGFVRHAGEMENAFSNMSVSGKPWKKHHNKNKREKLRRIYSELDN